MKFLRFRRTVIWKELRRHKSSSLGIPKASQFDISRSLKHLSLGMPRLASHLSSSSTIGKFWLSLSSSSHDMCYPCNVILFCFACCLNKVLKIWNFIYESVSSYSYLIIGLLIGLHLYLFGVVCRLLLCFNYILWVNCWMKWISWSWNYILPSGSFSLGLGSVIFWSLTITVLVIQAIHE